MKKKLIVGVTGASGAPLAVELLITLRAQPEWESHLVVTRGGAETIPLETGMKPEEVYGLANRVYDNSNIGAAIASGTFVTAGMVIVPCSMKTAAGIHSGYSDNLLLRAADVTLKEGRKLVLVARETPMSQIHLRNLYELSQAGATILPAMLTYYHQPLHVQDMTRHIVCKILRQWGIELPDAYHWRGLNGNNFGKEPSL